MFQQLLAFIYQGVLLKLDFGNTGVNVFSLIRVSSRLDADGLFRSMLFQVNHRVLFWSSILFDSCVNLILNVCL